MRSTEWNKAAITKHLWNILDPSKNTLGVLDKSNTSSQEKTFEKFSWQVKAFGY